MMNFETILLCFSQAVNEFFIARKGIERSSGAYIASSTAVRRCVGWHRRSYPIG